MLRKEAEAEVGQKDGQLLEKIMHLLKEEGALAQVTNTDLSHGWGLDSYMGVKMPGECVRGATCELRTMWS